MKSSPMRIFRNTKTPSTITQEKKSLPRLIVVHDVLKDDDGYRLCDSFALNSMMFGESFRSHDPKPELVDVLVNTRDTGLDRFNFRDLYGERAREVKHAIMRALRIRPEGFIMGSIRILPESNERELHICFVP